MGVPSALQTGQLMGKGMRPWTGSTSNLYFWPQLQMTLSSITIFWFFRKNARNCPTSFQIIEVGHFIAKGRSVDKLNLLDKSGFRFG